MLGLLIHVLFLSDVVSECPEELNPLSLDPRKVVKQLGEEFIVNCTSEKDEHDGMYWNDENGKSDPQDETKSVEYLVSLSNWNVKATCKIKLNKSLECSRDVEITVYKTPDNVTLHPPNPENAMVEEKQYELVCNIINVAPVQNLTVTWYKDKQIVTTTSFINSTKTPVNVSSTLPVTLSREENVIEFSCDAVLDFEDELPVSSETLSVTVHYAPEFTKKTEDVLDVQEGQSVTLTCEADGKPSPVYQWTSGDEVLGNSKNLTVAQKHGNVTYTCTAANSVGNITKEIHVHVINNITTASTIPKASTPKVTRCPIKVTPDKLVVRFGDPAVINCSALHGSGVGWEAVVGGSSLTDLSFLSWNVEKLEIWNPEPLCYINLEHEQCTVKPDITVYKPPDYVSVSAVVPGPMVEGHEVELRCDVFNVAPVQNLTATLYQGNENIETFKFSDMSNFSTPRNVSHTWKLTAKRSYHGKPFTCMAELHLGEQGPEPIPSVTSDAYIPVVHYKPMMGACESHYAGVEHDFSMDKLPCKADGNPQPTVVWFYQGKKISASEPLTRSQSGIYKAEIENILDKSSILVDITVEYAPTFACERYYEVEENGEPHSVTCEAQGIPSPNLTWFKDGQKMGSLVRWTKHDSGKYLLEAANKHGTAHHMLELNVLYAPTFKQQKDVNEIGMGANVTFECHADGNPVPQVHWNVTSAQNVPMTTRGSQSNLSITEATSTDAGEYICVATNKVGTATRSVTVRIKGETSGASNWVTIALIVSIIILTIIIIVLIVALYKRSKNSGQYSFMPVHVPLNDISSGCKA